MVADVAALVAEVDASDALVVAVVAELADAVADVEEAVAEVAADVAEPAAAVAELAACAALSEATEASLAASVVASPDPPGPLYIAIIRPYLFAIYIVTSKPNLISVYSGLVHIVFPLS